MLSNIDMLIPADKDVKEFDKQPMRKNLAEVVPMGYLDATSSGHLN